MENVHFRKTSKDKGQWGGAGRWARAGASKLASDQSDHGGH